MTSAENAEDGLDLYDDILVEDLTCQQDSLHEIEKKYKEALRTIAVLEDIKSQNEANITNLQKKNAYLMKNISVLYKTACVELERKKVIIESLQNERNARENITDSGFDYNYKDKCRNRMQASPYGGNMFEPQNHNPYENTVAPYDQPKWNAQYGDPHPFSPTHSSIYPNDSIAATNMDAPHSTQDYSSPYVFSDIAHKERLEKHISHNSHASHTAESTYTESYTSPMRNTDFHSNARDVSFCASQQPRYTDEHTPHTRYSDKHIPHTKQTDLSSHGKHSNGKQSASSSSHSKHSSSKTSASSHSDKRPSSSKSSHSDSRKHNPHSSSSHPSEPASSRSKHSESKKSGRSSRVSSKDRDPSTSSSISSARSRHRQSHSDEMVEVSNLRRSNSSDSKHKAEKYREQKAPVESRPTEEENLVDSKRKLPREFSEIHQSDHKRKRREESKSTKESASRSSRKEKGPTKSHRKKQVDLSRNRTKHKDFSFLETDRSVSLEGNENKISDSLILKSDMVNESPLLTGQDLETDHGAPMKVSNVPFTDKPVDCTLQEVTESCSIESVTKEVDNTIVSEPINSSSTSGNNHHESDIEDKSGDVEKEPDKCKRLDIETNESCNFILCTGNELSDSEENLVCREAGTELEAEKLESLSDTHSSDKKEETSGRSSEVSDAKSDTSDDPKNRSIIIQCFGNADDNSHSPIIIPCYPSKNKAKSCSSASDSDEDYVSRDHLMSTPSKRLIARSLFPITQPVIEKLPGVIEGSATPKAKRNIDGAFDGSIMSKAEDEQLEKADSNQESERSCSPDSSAAESSTRCGKVELDNLDIASSPILEKLSEDLMLSTEEINNSHWLDKDIETASSTKEEHHSDTSLDDNDTENCYPQINDAESLDKTNICSDNGLEEGEILTDEENESLPDTVATTEQVATVRSLVRYRKSFSPLDRRKNHSKWNREACRRKPHREPTKSDHRNRLGLSLHTDHFAKQSYRRDSGRSWHNRLLHSSVSSGSQSRSRQLDNYPGRSDVRHKSEGRSSSANRKRRTH